MQALRGHFRPEFLNRVDDVILYQQLQRDQIGHIVELQLERVAGLLREKRLEFDVTPEARDLLAERGYDPTYGARPVKRIIQRLVQDPLAMRILEGDFPEGSRIEVVRAGDGESLDFR